ncbi:hypothetical protein ACIP98_14890 [Streptomyces sp. NPDC088354]|uniref:hypothetical protein n=1 Tax=Streptomyces sp. NPDC088354 TaxID=3365856 RepID=UPI0038029920
MSTGVVRDGTAPPEAAARQALAAELGYSETVFVDDGAEVLRPPAGGGRAAAEGPFTRVRGRAEWAPGRRTQAYRSPAEVDAPAFPAAG